VAGFKDLNLREAWIIAPLMLVIVALGVYPKPLLDIINPSVQITNSVVRPGDPPASVFEQSPTNAACPLPNLTVATLSVQPCNTNGHLASFPGTGGAK
jgi:hypothetical protein